MVRLRKPVGALESLGVGFCRARPWLAIVGGDSCSAPSDMWAWAVPGSRAQGTAQERWATVSKAPDSVELLVEGLSSCSRLAGGDQESDQRPSVHVGRLSRATSGVGVSVRRSTIIVDGSKQPTFMAGEGIRISEPLVRPEAADIGDGRGGLKRRRRAVCWTIRVAGTERRSGEGARRGNPEGVGP